MRKLSYQPGGSLAHQLYPLTKFAWLLITTTIVFIIQDGFLLMTTAIIVLLLLVWINPRIWQVRGFRLAFITGNALFILYILFDKTGTLIFHPGIQFLSITSGGVSMGLRYSGRFLIIIFTSYIFILTTDPSDLAYALMRFGLPYRYGFMLVTALRLAPVMEDEAQTIYRAQLARGIRYDQLNLRRMLLLLQQFLTPLLIGALRRADKLVFSMEGRGFGASAQRTFRKRTSATLLDLLISFVIFLYLSLLITLNYWRPL